MSFFSKLRDLKSTGNSLTRLDWYPARVTNNNDPQKLQRLQFRLKGLHRGVPDIDLPWATPSKAFVQGNNAVGSVNIPVKGSTIWIQFLDENTPIYHGSVVLDTNTIPELTSVSYPNAYGFVDASGNKFFVDTQNDTVTFTHLSGAKIFINTDGVCSLDTKNLSLNVNGNLDVKSSGDVKIACQNFTVDSQTVAIKTTTLNTDATTHNSKTTACNISSAAYNLDATALTMKGGTVTISSAAALTLAGATAVISAVSSAVLQAASFALQAAFNLVPTMGWVTPPSPSPGSTTPPSVTPPVAANVTPPPALSPRTKPTITPFDNQVNY
jgi:hypothetical protein